MRVDWCVSSVVMVSYQEYSLTHTRDLPPASRWQSLVTTGTLTQGWQGWRRILVYNSFFVGVWLKFFFSEDISRQRGQHGCRATVEHATAVSRQHLWFAVCSERGRRCKPVV